MKSEVNMSWKGSLGKYFIKLQISLLLKKLNTTQLSGTHKHIQFLVVQKEVQKDIHIAHS